MSPPRGEVRPGDSPAQALRTLLTGALRPVHVPAVPVVPGSSAGVPDAGDSDPDRGLFRGCPKGLKLRMPGRGWQELLGAGGWSGCHRRQAGRRRRAATTRHAMPNLFPWGCPNAAAQRGFPGPAPTRPPSASGAESKVFKTEANRSASGGRAKSLSRKCPPLAFANGRGRLSTGRLAAGRQSVSAPRCVAVRGGAKLSQLSET
jgi:hypothetical protein